MRHYVQIIDSLGKENEGLKLENSQLNNQNRELSSQVANVSQQNEALNKRMVLAEKLNVTGLSLTSLKGNGKVEKKISKAKQLIASGREGDIYAHHRPRRGSARPARHV